MATALASFEQPSVLVDQARQLLLYSAYRDELKKLAACNPALGLVFKPDGDSAAVDPGKGKSVRSEGVTEFSSKPADVVKVKKKRNRRPKPPYDPASPFAQAIDAKQVAAALGCSAQDVYCEVAAGRLTHHRNKGRIYFLVPEILEHQRKQKIV